LRASLILALLNPTWVSSNRVRIFLLEIGKKAGTDDEIKQMLLWGVQGGGFLEKSPPGRRRQKGNFVAGDTLPNDTLELLRDPAERCFPPVLFFKIFLLSLKLKYIRFWVIMFYNAK
jgi:hypothetical protein